MKGCNTKKIIKRILAKLVKINFENYRFNWNDKIIPEFTVKEMLKKEWSGNHMLALDVCKTTIKYVFIYKYIAFGNML